MSLSLSLYVDWFNGNVAQNRSGLGELVFAVGMLWLLSVTNLNAQQRYDYSPGPMIYKSGYVEMLGSGGGLTLNYEWLFDGVYGPRVGLGVGNTLFEGISAPASAIYLWGDGSHHAEFGMGITAYVSQRKNTAYKGFEDGNVAGHAILGYRYVQRRGFVIRVSFTPLISGESTVLWGGMSIGYNFAP